MGYKKEEIKKGITLHEIDTNRFKTDLVAIFLTTPITRENVTKDALLDLVLRRGTKKVPSQEEISKKLENMYGASFDCGIDKIGDNHTMKFYLESINNDYIPSNEDILAENIDLLLEIIFNPILENSSFKEEYVTSEKEKLAQIIQSKIDDKNMYSLNRAIEEMYKNEPYGLYAFGYEEDLEKITGKELYEYYQKLIKECKIDIFISGNLDKNIGEEIRKNEKVVKLEDRNSNYIMNKAVIEKEKRDAQTVEEKMNISQGKLVMIVDVNDKDRDSKYVTLVYNAIFGGTANSKLFQNVREKEGLAYTAASSYVRGKNNIFIRCGIEIDKYNKAIEVIQNQIEDMKTGNFTEEDMKNAKNSIISTIKSIPDEQDTELMYYLGQELAGTECSVEEYAKKVQEVKKEEIIEIANRMYISMIYFLRN